MGKVLVLDEREKNREAVVELLSEAGHQPLEAPDGPDAIAMMKRERPEVVISDILMPTMDGYRFTQQVRSDQEIAEYRNRPLYGALPRRGGPQPGGRLRHLVCAGPPKRARADPRGRPGCDQQGA